MKAAAITKTYRCARCGRQLDRWVYSRATGNRYCVYGEGCGKEIKALAKGETP